jgi:hypothetical protein
LKELGGHVSGSLESVEILSAQIKSFCRQLLQTTTTIAHARSYLDEFSADVDVVSYIDKQDSVGFVEVRKRL